jgi:hypothetical protein
MPFRLTSAFVILLTSMLIGAQTPATVHDSTLGEPIDAGTSTIANGVFLLAPLPAGDYTLAASTNGCNLAANQIGSNFAVNSDAFEYPNQFQMHDSRWVSKLALGHPSPPSPVVRTASQRNSQLAPWRESYL